MSAGRPQRRTIWIVELPELTSTTSFGDEVVAWGAQGAGTTWHVRADCRWFARHAHAPVEIWCEAKHLETYFDGRTARGHKPCEACARPALIDLIAREAVKDEAMSRRLVLGCPNGRAAQEGSHARCLHCAELAAIADRNNTVTYTDAHGYRLTELTIHRDHYSTVARRYAVYPIPADCPPLTTAALGVAWKARDNGNPQTTRPPAQLDMSNYYVATSTLNFEAGTLVTAAPSSWSPAEA